MRRIKLSGLLSLATKTNSQATKSNYTSAINNFCNWLYSFKGIQYFEDIESLEDLLSDYYMYLVVSDYAESTLNTYIHIICKGLNNILKVAMLS
jgi:hypothetical protein